MSIGQFVKQGFKELRAGMIITGPFEQIGNFFPEEAAIPFGTLLAYGTEKKQYKALKGTDAVTAFAGVAVAEIAAAGTTYPGVKTQFEIMEAGNVLIQGSISTFLSVDGVAANVKEGGAVFIGTDGRASTVAQESGVAIPNLIFTGDVEVVGTVTLVGVKKLY